MTQLIEAPWTQSQVDSLNGYQQGPFASYRCEDNTCAGVLVQFSIDSLVRSHIWGKPIGTVVELREPAVLVATLDGFVCPACGCTQKWAYEAATDWSWRQYQENK